MARKKAITQPKNHSPAPENPPDRPCSCSERNKNLIKKNSPNKIGQTIADMAYKRKQ